jgi:hypothetical protein
MGLFWNFLEEPNELLLYKRDESRDIRFSEVSRDDIPWRV